MTPKEQLKRLEADIDRTTNAALEKLELINESLVSTTNRAANREKLDVAIWEIWSLVRMNEGNLDSEKICKQIRAVLDAAVSALQLENESLKKQSARDAKTFTKEKRELRARAKQKIEEERNANERLLKENADFRIELEAVKEAHNEMSIELDKLIELTKTPATTQ